MKPPAGLRACWVPVGGQGHAVPWAAPALDASGATVMGTLLASQSVHRLAKSGTLIIQTTWAVYVPGTLTEPRVRSIPPRTSACGALLFLRLAHPSASVPVALVLRV